MAKNKKPQEEPMNVGELLFVSSLAKRCNYKRENVINSKGLFPALRVITTKSFNIEEINLIKKGFKKRFKRVLLFTERKEKDCDLRIGYFTKQALAQ